MSFYKCDWCDEVIGCTQMRIEAKSYNLCANCKGKIEKKLEGKGEWIIFGYPLKSV